jgi:hypothetical protein
MSPWSRVLLALGLFGPWPTWGDGAPEYAMLTTRVNEKLDAYNSEPVVAENTDIPVQDEILNASGRTWTRLCLRLEHLNPEMTQYVPSARDDSLRFGIESLPDAHWSRTVELRINGIYAGRAGGNWGVVQHMPEAVEFVFHAPLVQAGDRVTLRFRLHDRAAIHQWRIRHRAATGNGSCAIEDRPAMLPGHHTQVAHPERSQDREPPGSEG